MTLVLKVHPRRSNDPSWIAIRVLITHYLKMFTEINYIVCFVTVSLRCWVVCNRWCSERTMVLTWAPPLLADGYDDWRTYQSPSGWVEKYRRTFGADGRQGAQRSCRRRDYYLNLMICQSFILSLIYVSLVIVTSLSNIFNDAKLFNDLHSA